MYLDRIAEEYARHKSSSSVFKEQHIKDFKAGYNKALEDSKATEMFEMLKYILDKHSDNCHLTYKDHEDIEKLIKEATEL